LPPEAWLASPSPQPPQRGEGVKARLARGGVRSRSRLCRVAGLSSAAAWGSEIRMSEGRAADKFANFPHDASSARKPAGPRTSARLSFGHVSLAKQRKVPRPPGRDPAKPRFRRRKTWAGTVPSLQPVSRRRGSEAPWSIHPHQNENQGCRHLPDKP